MIRRTARWLREGIGEIRDLARALIYPLLPGDEAARTRDRRIRLIGAAVAISAVGITLCGASLFPRSYRVTPSPVSPAAPAFPEDLDLTQPTRDLPRRFRANTYLPSMREGKASGSINLGRFLPKYDLIRIDDRRVWWESEHDDHENDTEDDHLMHRAMEIPFRRLVELVAKEGGTLKVQDAYRDQGIHATKSLHKEGRALDLTSDGISLEQLAKLCWAAGFDWVYYESPRGGGAHVHCSVRADAR